jgi:putative hemolysin
MSPLLGLILLIISVVFFALLNSMEIAIVGSSKVRARHLAEQGSAMAKALVRMQRDQDRFFSATVFLQNALVYVSAFASQALANGLTDNLLVIIGFTIFGVFVTSFFGELLPKVLAAYFSDKWALLVAIPASFLTVFLSPVVFVLSLMVSAISGLLFGKRMVAGSGVTEAELRMLIESSAEEGSVAEDEAELLDRVFHFGDRRVHEVMVPRTEMVFLWHEDKVADFYTTYISHSHSRFPIVEEDPDHVIGIVGIKDVLAAVATGAIKPDSPLDSLIRPAMLVPETKPIGDLFREMQASGTQMAIAVDEHGGVAGIVTLEMLLEEMVGPIADEIQPADSEIMEIDEYTMQVDGSLSIEEVRSELGIEIPEGPYDTIAGFVLNQLGHIPAEGEELTFDHHQVVITEMKGPKIESLRLVKVEE